MSGLDLKEMNASDFLDVVHFMFEDDLAVATGEELEAKSSIRTSLYRNMYEREYRNKIQKTNAKTNYGGSSNFYADGTPVGDLEDDLSDIEPFDTSTAKKATKPFIPATDINPSSVLPFGKDIDAPLG